MRLVIVFIVLATSLESSFGNGLLGSYRITKNIYLCNVLYLFIPFPVTSA